MKIKYVTEDGLLMIKNNADIVFREIIKGKEKTIMELFNDDSLIKETPYDIEEFTLDMSQPQGKESLTDGENVQRVYNHMKYLSDSQASDERIWTSYTLNEQIDYMRYRWKTENANDMLNRYFFNYSSQRSLFRNGIARLWWIGRVTYDERRNDPYELTKYICKNQDFLESICGRNIFNNPKVQKASISAIYDADRNGAAITREVVRGVSKYINLLSGTYLLDILSYEDIYTKVYRKLTENLEGLNDL
ncbi:hypothetical protein Q604_UNBC18358G0004 [human gut metagenome]|uniref:Uncharacterized protein n=1 Tax=human gut metagenome TaxID=408170 RepID=W1WSB2_9ZZZZ|nr:DUF6339 family protein [Clostridium butyricum]MDU5821218.1 DUF6339 family protein [Clostridium butyricum]